MKNKDTLPRKFRDILLFIPLLALCGGCSPNSRIHNAAPDEAVQLMQKHMDYCESKLTIGMPKEDALAFLPKPHNTNTENVCVWVNNYSNAIQQYNRQDWQFLSVGGGGYFVVFVDGKLATPLCSTAAFTPEEALITYPKFSREQAQKILGDTVTNSVSHTSAQKSTNSSPVDIEAQLRRIGRENSVGVSIITNTHIISIITSGSDNGFKNLGKAEDAIHKFLGNDFTNYQILPSIF